MFKRLLSVAVLAAFSASSCVPAFAQNASEESLLNCAQYEVAGQFTSPDNIASQGELCRVSTCAALFQKRNDYYTEVRKYPAALDEPFEEMFLRLKTSLDNYEQQLDAVCGTEAAPLPMCKTDSNSLTVLGNEVSTIRNACTSEVSNLMDIADTVLRELLLQMAGNQRTHAYARRIDALALEFNKINDMLAQIVVYLKKIKLPTTVGDPVQQ